MIAAIAVIDWRVDLNIAFAFFYLLPVLLLGTVLSRWQIVLTALLCTFLSDFFDPFAFTLGTSVPQDILVFAALAGSGLFSYEVTRRSRREAEDRRRYELEATARREAEEQLEFLIESSPAAILTTGADFLILRANLAAYRLLGLEQGALLGKSIRTYIPALGRVSPSEPRQNFRTEMQCRGVRGNGEVFLANVFFSTYNTAAGPRLAALVVDASEDLRDREESSLEQLLAGSRILVGAVSHEVRNVCGAITIMHENLVRSGVLSGNQDFEALGSLVDTLNRIASMELTQSSAKPQAGIIDVSEALDDLRIVLEPICHEADISVRWDVPHELPPVWADRHRLLQVLLNLTKNSERALRDADCQANRHFGVRRKRRRVGQDHRYRSRHQIRPATFSTVPAGRRIHWSGIVYITCVCEIVSWRAPARPVDARVFLCHRTRHRRVRRFTTRTGRREWNEYGCC